jgi:alpha-D-ribose 1-methylphosphonate 5-triphosphate synthase subunit PhnI
MAYVAATAEKGIEASIDLLRYYRSGTAKDMDIEAIENKMSLLVDRVMSEADFIRKLCRPRLETVRRLDRRGGFLLRPTGRL